VENSGMISPSRSGLRHVFRALKYRNYRLFFGGQCISLVGTWMQTVAMSWMVYRLTGSALLLGVAGFASQIPSVLLAPFTGVAADRLDRRRLIIVTQTLSMLQALALGLLSYYGSPQVWQLIALAACLGVVNAFDMPARQAFVVEMVEERADMSNAIALNSSMFNSARLIGPSIAGVCIAALGESACFMLNAASYLAVIAALMAMTPSKSYRGAAHGRSGEFSAGVAYAAGFPPIRYILLMLALTSLLGMPYAVLMPAYVKDILHGGPRMLGFVMAASGLGALFGALRLAARKHPAGLEKGIPFLGALFGLGLLGLSFSSGFTLSALCLALASYGMVSVMASSNTIIQTLVDDDKRGRVMAIYSVAFMGMAPFGSLLAGWTAQRVGVAHTMTLNGLFVLAASAAFASRMKIITAHAAPVYSRLGLGLVAAQELGEAERPETPL
jgi:MFS family permease